MQELKEIKVFDLSLHLRKSLWWKTF